MWEFKTYPSERVVPGPNAFMLHGVSGQSHAESHGIRPQHQDHFEPSNPDGPALQVLNVPDVERHEQQQSHCSRVSTP